MPVGRGKLDVACVPWCRVLINGRDLGKPSPILGHELPAGRYVLRLEHPPSGRSKEMELVIEAGGRVRKKARF